MSDNFYNFRQVNGDWLIVNLNKVILVEPTENPKFVELRFGPEPHSIVTVEASYERMYCLLKVHNV